MPRIDSGDQQEEERLPFFPSNNSANEKPWTFFSHPPNFLLLPINVSPFPCCAGTCLWFAMFVDPELQFSADLNKYIFVGDGSLFASGQNFGGSFQGPEENAYGSRAAEQTGVVPTVEPIVSHCISRQHGNVKFFLDFSSHPLVFEALQALFRIYLKALSFWLRFCSVCNYSFGTLV